MTNELRKFEPKSNGVTLYDAQGKWAGHMSLGGETLQIKSPKRTYNFEYHHYCGPIPLRKDGEPMERIPKDFWEALEQWEAAGMWLDGNKCTIKKGEHE